MHLPLLALGAALLQLSLPASAAPPIVAPSPASPISVGAAQTLAPTLQNAGMECFVGRVPQAGLSGTVPEGWTADVITGSPWLESARVRFTGDCSLGSWVEHLEGEDAWAFMMEDPNNPGAPFDAVLYQRVSATTGAVYSLSGWMVSFCGGNAGGYNHCPTGHYIAKMLGIDPTGGTDPTAATVVWVEDDRNFDESRWANLRLGATAQANAVTVFARIDSPFQHAGSHALVDAISLVAGPTAGFTATPETATDGVHVAWDGSLGSAIAGISGGTYKLYYDVQYRLGTDGDWQTWQTQTEATSAVFEDCTGAASAQFRVRPLAEQPEGSNGAWPNHRYPGVWTTSPQIALPSGEAVLPANVTTNEDTPVQVSPLAGSSPRTPDSSLAISLLTGPSHGKATAVGTTVYYTPSLNFNGTDVFTYRVNTTCPGAGSAVTVTVLPVNDPPAISVSGSPLYEKCTTVSLQVHTTDPEGDAVTLSSISGLPPGISADVDTGLIAGTLSCSAIGDYDTTIEATDGLLTSTLTFPLLVRDHLYHVDLPATQRH